MGFPVVWKVPVDFLFVLYGLHRPGALLPPRCSHIPVLLKDMWQSFYDHPFGMYWQGLLSQFCCWDNASGGRHSASPGREDLNGESLASADLSVSHVHPFFSFLSWLKDGPQQGCRSMTTHHKVMTLSFSFPSVPVSFWARKIHLVCTPCDVSHPSPM